MLVLRRSLEFMKDLMEEDIQQLDDQPPAMPPAEQIKTEAGDTTSTSSRRPKRPKQRLVKKDYQNFCRSSNSAMERHLSR